MGTQAPDCTGREGQRQGGQTPASGPIAKHRAGMTFKACSPGGRDACWATAAPLRYLQVARAAWKCPELCSPHTWNHPEVSEVGRRKASQAESPSLHHRTANQQVEVAEPSPLSRQAAGAKSRLSGLRTELLQTDSTPVAPANAAIRTVASPLLRKSPF